ncbi:MAG: copper resistance protein NlpE N-terminal domain-containing protein [Tannerella sp.]|jgi:heat shock protein HslJ|nr:copper resistance protein NlpE N-terminal domain-containing protein [Tannerella sp.]
MKKKLFICGISALMVGMVSCNSQKKDTKSSDTEVVTTADNSQNSLDWDGFYSGILPCADCGGIQTSLELLKDGTYELKQVYWGKDDNSFYSFGNLTWNKEGNTITIGEDESVMKFQVGENALTMLDKEGNKITGDLADNYILAKVDMNLVEKYWKLTELFGEAVVTPENGKEAHMILKKEGNRVNGNSGCNSFSGTYTLKPGNRIYFSKVASTMMMCINMDTEKKMHQVLETADNYVVNGDTLVLNKARMAPLARFEAVYMK